MKRRNNPDTASRTPRKKESGKESGNAFFMVMLGVVLFAALMFTFSRGVRQGGGDLSNKRAAIEATDIITYAQKVERAVQRVYGKGFSESNISFDNSFVSGYENGGCTTDRCRVFSRSGGGVAYKPLQPDWSLSATDWIFTGNTQVLGIGRDCTADACAELTMMIEDVPLTLCTAINEQLDVTTGGGAPPADDGIGTIRYTSSFTYDADADIGDEDATLNGVRTACLLETGNVYYFYHTLLER